jgi:MinD-like ATPase involved in chromosome partitioning or flagellar assembly
MEVEFEVPVDREVAVSVNRGVPIAISNPRSGVAKSLQDVADKLVPQRAAGGKAESGGGKKFRRKG